MGHAASGEPGPLPAAHRVVDALAFLVRRLVLPWPWSGFHSTLPAPGVPEVAAVLVLLGLASVLVRGSRAPRGAERGAAAGRGGDHEGRSESLSHAGRAAVLFTVVALVPAVGPAVFDVSLSPIADRYLYLPSVGLALMTAVLAVRLAETARGWGVRGQGFGLAVSGAAFLFALGAENVYAVGRYKDDLTFWGAAAGRAPEDGYALVKLGQALGAAGRTEEGEARIRAGLGRGGLPPGDSAIAIDNLGDLELRAGHLDEARPWLERAAEEAPGYALAHIHLARLHRALAFRARGASVQRVGEGSTRMERETTSEGSGPKPEAPGAPSETRGSKSETSRAPSETRGSRAITPESPAGVTAGEAASRIDVSRIAASHEHALAIEEVAKAIAIDPRNTEALLLRADLALDRGDRAEAIRAIEESLRYLPAGEQRARAERALRSLGGR